MKNSFIATLGLMFVLPIAASAQTFTADGGNFGSFLNELVKFANEVLIPFILAIGFLVFVWGMFQFFIAGGANEEKKESGKSLMIYATLGFVLIIIFWGLVNLLASSTGFNNQGLKDIPTAVINPTAATPATPAVP